MTAPDEDFLADWSRQQQAAAFTRDRQHDDRCATCDHSWHGLPCKAPGAAFNCACPTAFKAKTCTRCGETSASFCEDWDCHKGWS